MESLKLLVRVTIAGVILLLAGCGGSGGGSGTTTMALKVDFDSASSAQSAVTTLYDDLGRNVSTLSFNRSTDLQIFFTNLVPNQYRMTSRLYAGVNGSGSLLGTVQQWVNLTSDATVRLSAGSTPVNCVVTAPALGDLSIPMTRQFLGSVVDSNSRAVYTTGTFNYTVLGGVGSVSTEGVLNPNTAGSGFVRATHPLTGFIGASAVTVKTTTPVSAKWNILVFLNAANDLDRFSEANVKQMLKVSNNADVRFILQWKKAKIPSVGVTNPSFEGTKRVVLANGQTQLIQDMGLGVDMGDKDTLRSFLAWSKLNFPAARTCVVIWNHGNGWERAVSLKTRGVSYDDDSGHHIDTWDLAYACGPDKLDVISFDSSLMQMMEVMYDLKDSAFYIAGSEESPPGAGYPYDKVFQPFQDNPDAPTATLCNGFVDGMVAQYGTVASANLTQSVVDTSKLPALKLALSGLADALRANPSAVATGVQTTRNTSRKYEPEIGSRYYYDLDQICTNLKLNLPGNSAVNTACDAVKTAIAAAVTKNGVNFNSPNSKGIAIDFSPSNYFATYNSDYAKLQVAVDSTWDEYLSVAP